MSPLPLAEAKRRKRERVIIILLVAVVALLTYVETKIVRFGVDLPVSNTVLTFVLINLNMLLLLLLIFLVLRNIVKLLYDRKRKVMGAKLRTKLVVAFASLSLIPTVLLFFFSVQFISSSVAFWFNVPVEQSLAKSLEVGRKVYDQVEQNNRFFLERIAYQIVRRDLLDPKKTRELKHYVQVVQRAFNLQAVEVYSTRSERLAVGLDGDLEGILFDPVSADAIQAEIHENNFNTRTQFLPSGEMVRTLGAIPANAGPDNAIGIVAVTTVLPHTLAQDMAAITRGYEQYQQMKMVKRPIQGSHLVTLSIVALLIIFCATWFGFYLAKTLTIPIQELAEGTRRVAEGDLNFTIETVADDEMGTLVTSFNKMTRDLRFGKEQLELSTEELKKRTIEIEQRRIYMETILKNMSTGVVSLDTNGFFTTISKSAEKMLSVKAERLLGRSYKKAMGPQHLAMAQELLDELDRSPGNSLERTIKISIDQTPRTFMMHITALKDETDRYLGIMVVFDDLTEVEKAQRMAAWREVARRIAHEVKNPLTPIKLSAQRLERKYGRRIKGDNGVFTGCTKTIIEQVDQIRNLVNEFSTFARLPAVNLGPCSLPAIVKEAVALYREAHPYVSFKVNVGKDIPELTLDKGQVKRVLLNLIDNAIAAMDEDGGSIMVGLDFDPTAKSVRMEVSDNGMGISLEDKDRLFEPYFSTKKSGMGLGLSIVNAIIEDHQGTIRAEDNAPAGTKFIIELPA